MPIMRSSAAAVLLALVVCQPAWAAGADTIATARQAYNAGDYDAAIDSARGASADPRLGAEARVVLGRALLERYRRTGQETDLSEARGALLEAGSAHMTPSLRSEWLVGSAVALFFEGQFGASASVFTTLVNDARAVASVPGGRERLLDWWATACDRAAQGREPEERRGEYARLDERLRQELEKDPSLGTAAYWRVVAARGAGDLNRAWDAAIAAWVRAPLASDHGAELRADLERFVTQALIPERARRLGPDQEKHVAALRAEWDGFKERWSAGLR
jgi:hypothetical protein